MQRNSNLFPRGVFHFFSFSLLLPAVSLMFLRVLAVFLPLSPCSAPSCPCRLAPVLDVHMMVVICNPVLHSGWLSSSPQRFSLDSFILFFLCGCASSVPACHPLVLTLSPSFFRLNGGMVGYKATLRRRKQGQGPCTQLYNFPPLS